MLEKILGIGGLIGGLVGGLMQAYPGLLPPDANFYVGWFIIIVSALSILASFVIKKRREAAMSGDQFNNYGTNNGHMGNVTNNFGPRRVILDDELKSALLAQIPKGVITRVMLVGSANAIQTGHTIVQFLNDNGYELPNPMTVGVLAPPPSKPVELSGSALVIAADLTF